MSIKKLTKEAISNVSGGKIIEIEPGVFYVLSDDEFNIVLDGSFCTQKEACESAKKHNVSNIMLNPSSHKNVIDSCYFYQLEPNRRGG